jgi:predicted Zn-dependent peptidase
MQKEFQIHNLKNGMRVLTVPLPQSETVTVLTLVNTGSDYELPNEAGISHFLEHMCFKGTVKRPTAHSILMELDNLGAETNAFTDHEITGYYAKGDAKHWKKFVDIIADVYLNSTFPADEIEKEKGVIIEEINMYEDMPQNVISERFEKFMYGESPVGLPILGNKESVRSFTRDNFVNYHTRQYNPQNTVIIVAGPVKNTDVNKEVEKYFKNFTGTKVKKIKPVLFPKLKNPILNINKNTDQVHAVIGFGGYMRGSPKSKKAKLLAGILGSGMSSRLFQLLREELGVCYYITAGQSIHSHSGRFLIASGLTKDSTSLVITKIIEECKKIKNHKISEIELQKVKNYLTGMSKMGLESSDARAYFYGSQLLLDKEVKTINQKIKDINDVTTKDVVTVAKELFNFDNLYIGLIGPENSIKLNPGELKKLI